METAGFEANLSGGGSKLQVASVQVKLNKGTFDKLENRMQKGLLAMAYDIQRNAIWHAPVLTGALRNSIRVEPPKDNAVEIVAGGGVYAGYIGKSRGTSRYIGYAWKREQGPNRNPATEHYMEHGARDVLEGNGGKSINNYFK